MNIDNELQVVMCKTCYHWQEFKKCSCRDINDLPNKDWCSDYISRDGALARKLEKDRRDGKHEVE